MTSVLRGTVTEVKNLSFVLIDYTIYTVKISEEGDSLRENICSV